MVRVFDTSVHDVHQYKNSYLQTVLLSQSYFCLNVKFFQCCKLTKVYSGRMTLWAYKNCGFTISYRTQALLVGDGTLGRTRMWLA